MGRESTVFTRCNGENTGVVDAIDTRFPERWSKEKIFNSDREVLTFNCKLCGALHTCMVSYNVRERGTK